MSPSQTVTSYLLDVILAVATVGKFLFSLQRTLHDELYNVEYLNAITISNFPHHRLVLKVGCPVMLLRNIDQTIGLCNGTRLIITRLASRIVEATIMIGSHIGRTVYIPRITLMSKKSKYPFVLERR